MIERTTGLVRERTRVLLDLLHAPGCLPPGWRLAAWELEQGLTLRFGRGADPALEIDLERADPARPCYARTRDFNVYYSLFGRAAAALTPDEDALVAAAVRCVRRAEARLPVLAPHAGAAPAGPARVHVRAVDAEQALVAEAPGMYYLNPYLGCILGCRYCYGIGRAEFVRDLGDLAPLPWGRWLDVKVNAPALLARELPALPPGSVRMSPLVTDPYQPAERRFRVTRRCLDVLRGHSAFLPVVLTRSPVVLDDVALLRAMPRVLVGVSVPTDDDRVRAAFEPHAPPIEARVAALRALREAGLRTFAVVHPMLPMDPARLVARVAPWVEAVRVGPMAEKHRVAALYAALGRPDALTEAWEVETAARLRDGFARHGVPVNPRTEPWDGFR